MSIKSLHRGFTLIETLVYLALFSILMSGAIVGSYQLLQGGAHDRALAFTQSEGTFINRKINWALSGASDASVTGSQLDITRTDLGEVLHIDASGPNMTLRRNTGAAVILNSDEFKPQNVVFLVTPGSNGTPTLVTVTFTIHDRPFILKKYLR
jgi:prepilin-type N-terminal cleavage/methylation domain-containing protein